MKWERNFICDYELYVVSYEVRLKIYHNIIFYICLVMYLVARLKSTIHYQLSTIHYPLKLRQ
jgi:hypothetical protein